MATRLAIARLTKAREHLKNFSNQDQTSEHQHQRKKQDIKTVKTKKGKLVLDKWTQVIAAEKERAIHERQFHLHPLNHAKDPDVIQFHIGCSYLLINLKWLRAVLVISNIIIGFTAYECFKAWTQMQAIKDQATLGLTQQEKDKDPFNIPHHWLHEKYHALAHGFAHGDQIFFACGTLLTTYYLIYGLFIPCNYGKNFTDMKFSVLGGLPICIVIGSYLMFVAFAFYEFHQELNAINVHLASRHVSFMRINALLGILDLMNQYQPLISSILFISAIVMILQNLLPFFIYDLPFQREMDVDDFVLCFDPKAPRTLSVMAWHNNNEPKSRKIVPYRDLSAAYTVMLHLVKPELRDFHRSK